MRAKQTRRSPAMITGLIGEIDQLVEQGSSVRDACRQFAVAPSVYHRKRTGAVVKPKRAGRLKGEAQPKALNGSMTLIPAWDFSTNEKYICAISADGRSALIFSASETARALEALKMLR